MFEDTHVYPIELRGQARELYSTGLALRAVARHLKVPYHTIRYWCSITKTPDSFHAGRHQCPRCMDPPSPPADLVQYAYLLGQYLGDGHLAITARVPVLRICCTSAYPEIMDECEQAMRAVMAKSVQRVHSVGCTYIQAYSMHWPCLLPQSGPGKKHERPIVLEEWQREIVTANPGSFVRGCFTPTGAER